MTAKDYAKVVLVILVLIVLALAYIVATHQGPFVTSPEITYTGDVYQVSVSGQENLTCTGPDCDAALIQQAVPTPEPMPEPDEPPSPALWCYAGPAAVLCGGILVFIWLLERAHGEGAGK